MSKFSNLRTLQTAEWAFWSENDPETIKQYPRYLLPSYWATRPEQFYFNGEENPPTTVHILNVSDLINETIGIDAILTNIRLLVNNFNPTTEGASDVYMFAYYDTKINTPDYIKGYEVSNGKVATHFDLTVVAPAPEQTIRTVGQYFSDWLNTRADINEGDDIKNIKYYLFYGPNFNPSSSIEATAPTIECMLKIDLQA